MPAAYPDFNIQKALNNAGLGGLALFLDEDASWTHSLSCSEQQRLAIARALLLRPDRLWLDEPIFSFDPKGAAELVAIVHSRLPETAIVFVAHFRSGNEQEGRKLPFAGLKGNLELVTAQ